MSVVTTLKSQAAALRLPSHRDPYYGGKWQKASRYVEVHLPPGSGGPTIPDGGVVDTDKTTSAVDLDQIFNTFDPRTRRALTRFIRGSAAQYRCFDAT